MNLLIVIMLSAAVILIYYAITGKRPQAVIQEALAGK